MRSRLLWLGLLILIVVLGWFVAADGHPWLAVPLAAFIAFYGWWTYPRRGAGTSHTEAMTLADDDPRGRVIIYWRPGCMYSSGLRRALGRTGRSATWVNIWTDDEAAAFVRSVNGGNETVPTVVIEGEAHTNPPAGLVRDRLLARLR
ncbi:glutaredoxin domain-containing protein [Ruania halotolerans]|uniref:glutaredoxin domain-containing protein n=1 Tax=Ruania halotolerans TaxID=2897773 RepID=UPI001E2E28FA|nr:glutaredoxin domain-containing protein [Ruania halotolerans]UFU05908.1 hypothetical protein LQF10_15975 [Ruania halotolerans]